MRPGHARTALITGAASIAAALAATGCGSGSSGSSITEATDRPHTSPAASTERATGAPTTGTDMAVIALGDNADVMASDSATTAGNPTTTNRSTSDTSGPQVVGRGPASVGGLDDGCHVSLIGDSLVAGSEDLVRAAARDSGCLANVDAMGGRSLSNGWQCRVDGNWKIVERSVNETCRPSGLELLDEWSRSGTLGDIVVIALGTNDAGLRDEAGWRQRWERAMAISAPRPVVFVSTAGSSADRRTPRLERYNTALRTWCAGAARCQVAEWALTSTAYDDRSYTDGIHLTRSATQARAAFFRDVISTLLAGRRLVPPAPFPTTTTSTTTTSTTTTSTTTAPLDSTTPSTSTTVGTTSPPTTTQPADGSTSTTTTSAPTATTTSSTTTSTEVPAATSTSSTVSSSQHAAPDLPTLPAGPS